jgi:hypothetical protein
MNRDAEFAQVMDTEITTRKTDRRDTQLEEMMKESIYKGNRRNEVGHEI